MRTIIVILVTSVFWMIIIVISDFKQKREWKKFRDYLDEHERFD